MSFFVLPERWIKAAILAAVAVFGGLHQIGHVHIRYANLPHNVAGQAVAPATIVLDKRRHWPREKAQCLIAHEYGHLRGRHHVDDPRSIMFPFYDRRGCHRWLRRHLP